MYYVSAMWHVLVALSASVDAQRNGSSARPSVMFDVFSERPPGSSWAGKRKVPPTPHGVDYVDEYGWRAEIAPRSRVAMALTPAHRW